MCVSDGDHACLAQPPPPRRCWRPHPPPLDCAAPFGLSVGGRVFGLVAHTFSTRLCSCQLDCDLATRPVFSSRNCMGERLGNFAGNFDRPNLRLQVLPKPDKDKDHVDAMGRLILQRGWARVCGIIYCLARKETESVAQRLRDEHGIEAGAYHAYMSDEERQRTHSRWREGRLPLVVATIAFGLGINHPQCRYVLHATMSKGLVCSCAAERVPTEKADGVVRAGLLLAGGRPGRARRPARVLRHFCARCRPVVHVFASWAVLAEIYLCNVCSCQEIPLRPLRRPFD
jgi:hypothetical protein